MRIREKDDDEQSKYYNNYDYLELEVELETSLRNRKNLPWGVCGGVP